MNERDSERDWRAQWEGFAPAPWAGLAVEAVQPRPAPDWLSADQRRTLGAISFPGRREEWLAARIAERRLADEAGNSGLLTSVAHSHGWAVAIACRSGGDVTRVGVDLEHVSRTVRPRVAERLTRSGEERWLESLAPLELWVLKEAAFKATPRNQGTSVLETEVVDWETTPGEGWARSGVLDALGLRCRIKLGRDRAWKLAFAYTVKRLE